MNLNTIIANLTRTIDGKTEAYETLTKSLELCMNYGERAALIATIEYLKLNIDELKAIRKDVVNVLAEILVDLKELK